MKLRIVKENDYFQVDKVVEAREVRSNNYGCALIFGDNDYITLPDASYIQLVKEEIDEKYPFDNRSFPVSG